MAGNRYRYTDAPAYSYSHPGAYLHPNIATDGYPNPRASSDFPYRTDGV